MSDAHRSERTRAGMSDRIQELINANVDSQIRLQAVAEHAADAEMRLLLQTLAAERYAQAMELKYTARALGFEGDGDASWPGDLHGDATEVRAAGIRGMRALLDSVEAAEVSLRDAYEQALPHCDGGQLGQLVRDHLAALRRTGLRLAQTRRSYEQKIGSPSQH